MTITALRNVSKWFESGDKRFSALDSINLEIKSGEFCGLVGPSGSGKTTLLNLIGTLDKPSAGEAEVLGHDISKLTEKDGAALRSAKIGFVFQTFNLLPVYTVYENVEFPLMLLKIPASARRSKVMEALSWVNLVSKANSRPNQLSGGEAQRVSIARAIVKKPPIILADEPTANLDTENSLQILETMRTLNKELNSTFIFSTHDQRLIQYLTRCIHLTDGKISRDESLTVSNESAFATASVRAGDRA